MFRKSKKQVRVQKGELMNDKTRQQIMKNRELLKGYSGVDVGAEKTDQEQKIPGPAPVKKYCTGVQENRSGINSFGVQENRSWINNSEAQVFLPEDFSVLKMNGDFSSCIAGRKSRRAFAKEPIKLLELSYLLWATQGIRNTVQTEVEITFRNVPSAGSRHPLETYLFINHVEEIEPGLYHYRPDLHLLEKLDCDRYSDKASLQEDLKHALCSQTFAAIAPVLFVWSAIPYRCEWRYGLKAAKYILLDAGHTCENLYLAAENIGLGVCAVGAYDQDLLDEVLGFLPGPSAEPGYECAVYAAAVGRVRK